MSNDVAKTQAMWDDETLGGIHSFSDAMAVLSDKGLTPVDASDFGTGFSVVDKATLVNTPFVILRMKFNDGDHGVFVSCEAVTEDGRKVVINDGSTGIRAQCERIHKTAPGQPVLVKRGLTRSDYTYIDEKGTSKAATTFYLSQ